MRSHTGRDVPADCNTVSCPVCIVPITRRTAKALAMAQPDQMLTITGLSRTRASALNVMSSLRRWFDRRNIRGAWAFHLEVNPKKARGAHAHVWWRGDRVSEPVLSEAAVASGAEQNVDVQDAFAPRGTRTPALTYGFKTILENRLAVPTGLTREARAYLDLNGGRLLNTSQGFWIDWNREPVDGDASRARTIANSWTGPFPRTRFLADWHEHRLLNAF